MADLPRLTDNEIIAVALERYAQDMARERNGGLSSRRAEHGRRAARAREMAEEIRDAEGVRILRCTRCGHVSTATARPARCERCREPIPESEAA